MLSRFAIAIPQSGVIPYRIQAGGIEVLLITSSRGKRWLIPKGLVEFGMTAANSAAKEAWEEAGIVGTVHTPAIGTYRIRKWRLPCQVEVFLMRVERLAEEYPEAQVRQRQWFSLTAASQRVKEPDLKHMIEQLPQALKIADCRLSDN